jgi:hypothetical protein
MSNFDVNTMNANPVTVPTSHYANNKGDIKTLVRMMKSQAKDFENRDLVGEFNTISEKNTPCKSGSPKQPSIKFLNSVEKELKQANAHVGGTVRIAKEYAKLLHNKNHLNEAFQKVREETILNTLRSGYQHIDDISMPTQSLPNTQSTHDNHSVAMNNTIPMGKITTQTENKPQNAPKIEISKADATYNLSPAPDIFSNSKTGHTATYKIVPFNLVTGA